MLMIGTPCHNGQVTINYMHSVLDMVKVLDAEGIDHTFFTTAYDSLITRARNYIANEFLRQEQCTHLLFIDSDLGFAPETAARFFRSGRDVVCGVYPTKHMDMDKLRGLPQETPTAEAEAAAMIYAARFKTGRKIAPDGFVEVEYGPTGFMMIARGVLEKMALAHPELRYRQAFIPTPDRDKDNFAFFDTAIDPETRDYLPEDYAFCKRWADLGGSVHADMLSNFTHVGSREYRGDFTAFLTHFGREQGI